MAEIEIQSGEVRAGLSRMYDRIIAGDRYVITRNGRPTAVLLSFEEWKRLASDKTERSEP